MSYLLIAGDINKGGHAGSPPASWPHSQGPPSSLLQIFRLKWALGRRQFNIPKFQGENIPLQASHLPHGLI